MPPSEPHRPSGSGDFPLDMSAAPTVLAQSPPPGSQDPDESAEEGGDAPPQSPDPRAGTAP